jgi:hypothetical protein
MVAGATIVAAAPVVAVAAAASGVYVGSRYLRRRFAAGPRS